MAAETWEQRAACNDHPLLPPDYWDTIREGELEPGRRYAPNDKLILLGRWVAAVRVCEECPVLQQCLEGARAEPTDGVIRAGRAWGTRAQQINSEIREYRGRRQQAVA